jgi:Bacteriocin-protection, YdeI or OmpD-Associated/Domain of unknown function (DUF1905)
MTHQTKILEINKIILLTIPKELDLSLPSRGLVMVKGKINNIEFKSTLEPDGRKGHWLLIDNNLYTKIKAKVGELVIIELESTKEWVEPIIPNDLNQSLKENNLTKLWNQLTPMARWEWIRWINSTKNEATRSKRIEVGISKLNKGSKRPCCFNASECTVQEVSKNGVLNF